MPLLVTPDNDLTDPIQLPTPGEWVRVKKRLGIDEERALKTRLLSSHTIPTTGGAARIDLGVWEDMATFATFEIAIKEWSFPQPITPRNIRALDDASIAFLTEKLNELYPAARSDADTKGSSASGVMPPSTVGTSPESSAG